nr:DUF4129 domain-containing protein [Haloarchaeobius litoreus]
MASAQTRTDDEGAVRSGGAAAGATGRHPASADASDPVRRAWQRMVADLQPPSPGARTPGELAETAKAHGRDAGAVDRLTHLFQTVRYGRHSPEECADEARRLADRVAGEDSLDSPDTPDEVQR